MPPPLSSVSAEAPRAAEPTALQSADRNVATALHLDTCLTFFAALLTCRLVVVYGRRLPANLMSARRVSSLLETDHLPLLGQSSGTVSLMTLHRPHRCQYSERN